MREGFGFLFEELFQVLGLNDLLITVQSRI